MNTHPRQERVLGRSPTDGLFLGVCAGIANYTGVDTNLVRLVTVILQFIFPMTWLAYIAFAIFLPNQPAKVSEGDIREDFQTRFQSVEREEQRLEQRLAVLEAFVTADGFEMEMKVGGLGNSEKGQSE